MKTKAREQDTPHKLLTPRELSQRVGVSYRIILQWTTDGTIPAAVREGKLIRYEITDVLAALARRAKRIGGAFR